MFAVRFAQSHAVCEIIGIEKLDEDDLYENLAWLHQQQEEIEKKLFNRRFPYAVPTLFLYDVTSSYLEVECNELADWGYGRDKKKGKMQIVVGMLAGPDGLPVAVRVFRGNTSDTQTVSEQVRILAENFGVKEVTLVGDRGMLKGPQIDKLPYLADHCKASVDSEKLPDAMGRQTFFFYPAIYRVFFEARMRSRSLNSDPSFLSSHCGPVISNKAKKNR